MERSQNEKVKKLCKKFAGAIYLSLVVLIWVISAMLIQIIFSSGGTDFSKPLFLTYYSTAFFTFYLIPDIFRFLIGKWKSSQGLQANTSFRDFEVNTNQRKSDYGKNLFLDATTMNLLNFKLFQSLILRIFTFWISNFCLIFSILHVDTSYDHDGRLGENSCLSDSDDQMLQPNQQMSDSVNLSSRNLTQIRKLNDRETFKISLMFCMLWFLANYFYNSGLNYTEISSSVILSNTSILFVLMFSLILLKSEKFSLLKLIGVLISFAGATMITISESEGSSKARNRILGDVFTVISALVYGLYATFLKLKLPSNEDAFSMTKFLGFVGVWNIVLLLPLFPIFHFTGLETFELPNARTLGFLTLNAIIGTCLSDFWWTKSVVLLGPVFTQLGITLTIPLGIIVTSFYDKVSFSFLSQS